MSESKSADEAFEEWNKTHRSSRPNYRDGVVWAAAWAARGEHDMEAVAEVQRDGAPDYSVFEGAAVTPEESSAYEGGANTAWDEACEKIAAKMTRENKSE